MPLFPFLSFLLFGNGREKKKEGKTLSFKRKEQEFLLLLSSYTNI